MLMENNTLSGFHIRSKKGDPLKLYPKNIRGISLRIYAN